MGVNYIVGKRCKLKAWVINFKLNTYMVINYLAAQSRGRRAISLLLNERQI
jgi:hypothetical protein